MDYSVDLTDLAIVIATDGLWRFLTPEKVGSIVINHSKLFMAEDAANEIVNIAAQRWI